MDSNTLIVTLTVGQLKKLISDEVSMVINSKASEKPELDYLTRKEICRFLKCSHATEQKYRDSGMPFLRAGNTLWYIKADVIAWMKENR